MEDKEVVGKVKIYCRDRVEEKNAIFDTGADYSYMSPDIAIDFSECIYPLSKKIQTSTANRDSELDADKYLATEIEFDKSGMRPVIFLIPKNMRQNTLILGRIELDSLHIKFTPDGPKSIKTQYSDVLL